MPKQVRFRLSGKNKKIKKINRRKTPYLKKKHYTLKRRRNPVFSRKRFFMGGGGSAESTGSFGGVSSSTGYLNPATWNFSSGGSGGSINQDLYYSYNTRAGDPAMPNEITGERHLPN